MPVYISFAIQLQWQLDERNENPLSVCLRGSDETDIKRRCCRSPPFRFSTTECVILFNFSTIGLYLSIKSSITFVESSINNKVDFEDTIKTSKLLRKVKESGNLKVSREGREKKIISSNNLLKRRIA